MEIRSQFPPATPQAIASFESAVGASLPESFIEFLRRHNGGAPDPQDIVISEEEGTTDVQMIFGLNDDKDYDLRVNADIYQGRIPRQMLAIATDSGGNLFCLSLAAPTYGEVFFWDHERETDPDAPKELSLTPVAGSFDALLANLVETEYPDLGEAKASNLWIKPGFLEKLRRGDL